MIVKKLKRYVSFFVLFLAISGCYKDTQYEFTYKDIIMVSNEYFEVTTEEISPNALGDSIGVVKYTTPKTDGKYEFVDYEASQLPKGSKIFNIKNEKECVAVEVSQSSGLKYLKYVPISKDRLILNEE